MKKIAYVGIDYHVKQITAAVMIEGEKDFYETIHLVNKDNMIAQYLKKLSDKCDLKICYEASSSGYHFQRKLKAWGYKCDVIAPSLIPKKAGNRRKNDFRDARNLAQNYASGQLTVVHPPDEQQEAVRNVVRCRLSFKDFAKDVKQKINSLLLSQGQRWAKSKWTQQHRQWLKQISFADAHLQLVFQEYLAHLEHIEICVARLDVQIAEIAKTETYASSVKKLRALKGLGTLSAMILIAEITDFRRFASPRALMAYLGLNPSENTSSDIKRGGSITKTGNRYVRTQIVESIRHYIKKPFMNKAMKEACAELDAESSQIVQKCMHRLHKRYWALVMKGKCRNVALVAIAREFVGFVWALMTQQPAVAHAA